MSARRNPSRRPVAQHGALRSPNPIAQVLTVIGAIVAVLVLSAGSVVAFAYFDTTRAIDDHAVALEGEDEGTLPPMLGEIEGGVNLLVVGTDSCEGQDLALFPRCANDDSPGERNDVTMLVHISDEPRRVTVVSFPRDMIVSIPSCPDGEGGRYDAMSAQPINASYAYGGLPCTALTVEALTGVDVQYAAAIRWTGVINMSDAIGGVEVCVSEDISDVKHTGLQLSAGTHTLSGAEALQFLRIRHGIGDGSDLGRISNQQQFMSSMVRKLQSEEVLSNTGTLLNLARTAISQVTSGQLVLSESLANPQRMVQIAMAVSKVPYSDIKFVQYPTAYSSDGSHVVPIREAGDELFALLAANTPFQITGDASQGYGVEVTGEAEQPTTEATDAPTDAAGDAGAEATDPPVPDDSGAVDLPNVITGQSADQVTCTVAQH